MTKESSSSSGRRHSIWSSLEVAAFLTGAPSYVSKLTVTAERVSVRRTWRTKAGSVLTAQAGDWLLSDGESCWSVAAEVFDDTYRHLGNGLYAKNVVVVARQLRTKSTIMTLEGPSFAEAGDWIVRNPGGDVWPVPESEFHRRYELLTG